VDLGAAAVLRCPHPQGPVHVFRHVSDRQDRHDKHLHSPSLQRSEIGFSYPSCLPRTARRMILRVSAWSTRKSFSGVSENGSAQARCGSDLLCTRQRGQVHSAP